MNTLSKTLIPIAAVCTLATGCDHGERDASVSRSWQALSAKLSNTSGDLRFEHRVWRRGNDVVRRLVRKGVVSAEYRCEGGVFSALLHHDKNAIVRDDVPLASCTERALGEMAPVDVPAGAERITFFGKPALRFHKQIERGHCTDKTEIEMIVDAATHLPLQMGRAGDADFPLLRLSYSGGGQWQPASEPPAKPTAKALESWHLESYRKLSRAAAKRALRVEKLPTALRGLPYVKTFVYRDHKTMRHGQAVAVWRDGASGREIQFSVTPMRVATPTALGLHNVPGVASFQAQEGTDHMWIHAGDERDLRGALAVLRPELSPEQIAPRPTFAASGTTAAGSSTER